MRYFFPKKWNNMYGVCRLHDGTTWCHTFNYSNQGQVILFVPSFLQRHAHCSETSTHKETLQPTCILFLELLRGTIKSNIKTSFGPLSGFPLHEINISILATVSIQQSSFCHPVSRYRDVLSGLKPQ